MVASDSSTRKRACSWVMSRCTEIGNRCPDSVIGVQRGLCMQHCFHEASDCSLMKFLVSCMQCSNTRPSRDPSNQTSRRLSPSYLEKQALSSRYLKKFLTVRQVDLNPRKERERSHSVETEALCACCMYNLLVKS